MRTLNARNVNEALRLGVLYLKSGGRSISVRGQDTLEYEHPIVTTYREPRERVCTISERNANPFFHLFESLWMLAGRRDVEYLAQFNSHIGDYSDDGRTFHAPYGWRLRTEHGFDQIKEVIKLLRLDRNTRRAVLGIWTPALDLGTDSLDIPCNDTIFFKSRDGYLNMTVCCRSNDMIWGAYGVNAVQFSMLQEYVAAHFGNKVGLYHQLSDSLHVYCNAQWEKLKKLDITGYCPYVDGDVRPFSLVANSITWDSDLTAFMQEEQYWPYSNPFFNHIALPMLHVWRAHKENREGAHLLHDIYEGSDWRYAAEQWINKKEEIRV